MQTFVPLINDIASASVLDDKRLLKQIVEASQILKALSNPSYGWQRHPLALQTHAVLTRAKEMIDG